MSRDKSIIIKEMNETQVALDKTIMETGQQYAQYALTKNKPMLVGANASAHIVGLLKERLKQYKDELASSK